MLRVPSSSSHFSIFAKMKIPIVLTQYTAVDVDKDYRLYTSFQKSSRLPVDWHVRDPGFERTASSCVLLAVSDRSGGR